MHGDRFAFVPVLVLTLAGTAIVRTSGEPPLERPAESRERGDAGGAVTIRRVPNGGIQPESVRDDTGTLHLLYFSGEPSAGDLFYIRSRDDGATFTTPIQVNSQPGSAIAAGAIRGGQLAIGKDGRAHVAWNGSNRALPRGLPDRATGLAGSQFLYARLNDRGTAFEPQRGLMHRSVTLDGGGTIAADEMGNVFAAWHGNDAETGNDGEGRRQVWIARSSDGGRTFAPEVPAWNDPTGACACCGMRLLSHRGVLYLLYRSARASVNRDVFLLVSRDSGKTFTGSALHEWDINACPMTSMSLARTKSGVTAAWETQGLVYFTPLASRAPLAPPAQSDAAKVRKHPRLAVSANGETLLAWTEGTSRAREGSVAWQVFDERNTPTAIAGRLDGVPVLSFATVVARRDGGFTLFY